MRCNKCSEENALGSNYCSNCGKPLPPPQPTGDIVYGVFCVQGRNYVISAGLFTTIEEVMLWQNSAAVLSLSNPHKDYYLAEVTVAPLHSQDPEHRISTRLTVIKWWKLNWQDNQWVQGNRFWIVRPYSIGLSAVEN